MSGVTELLLIGIVIGALLTIWGVTSCSGGSDSPRDDANHDCEVAWVREYDGDDDTKNETAILDQQWCQDHLAMQEQEVQQEQIEQVAPWRYAWEARKVVFSKPGTFDIEQRGLRARRSAKKPPRPSIDPT